MKVLKITLIISIFFLLGCTKHEKTNSQLPTSLSQEDKKILNSFSKMVDMWIQGNFDGAIKSAKDGIQNSRIYDHHNALLYGSKLILTMAYYGQKKYSLALEHSLDSLKNHKSWFKPNNKGDFRMLEINKLYTAACLSKLGQIDSAKKYFASLFISDGKNHGNEVIENFQKMGIVSPHCPHEEGESFIIAEYCLLIKPDRDDTEKIKEMISDLILETDKYTYVPKICKENALKYKR